MKRTRIPSPARSVGPPVTPRRHKARATRSVGSPARSNASGRLSTLVQKFQDNNDSLVLSPMSRASVLSDNTDVELPRRKSWWKKLDDNSREIIEVVHRNRDDEVKNVLDDYLDEDTLTQERLDYIMDIPESSGSESISSIVLPQRRLFTHKQSQLETNLWPNVKSREALAKLDKTKAEDKTLHVKPKKLFGQEQQKGKPIFSKALIISPNKTLLNDELTNVEPKKLFSQESSKKKKRPANPLSGVHALEKEEDLAKPDKSEVENKTLHVKAKKLFGREQQREKPVFPKALIASPDKTLPNDELTNFGPKKLFCLEPPKKTKKSLAFPSALEKEANEPGTSGHRNDIGKPLFSSTLIASPDKTFSNYELSSVKAKKIFRQVLTKRTSGCFSDTDHDSEKETIEPEHRNLFGQQKKRTKFNFPALSIEHSMANEEQGNASGVKVDNQSELERSARNEDQNKQEEEKIEQSVQEDEEHDEDQENIDENLSVPEDAKENEQSNEEDAEQDEESVKIKQYELGEENSKDIDQSFAEKHENDDRFQIRQTMEKNKETNDQSLEVSVELSKDVKENRTALNEDQNEQEKEKIEQSVHEGEEHAENQENIDENRSVLENAKQSNEEDNEQKEDSIEIEQQGKENSKDIDRSFAEKHENDDRFQIRQTMEKNKETNDQSVEVYVELNEDVQENVIEMDQDDQKIEDETKTRQISIHLENEENIHTKEASNNIDQITNVSHDTTGLSLMSGRKSKVKSPETKLQQPVEKDKEIYENQKDKEGHQSFVEDGEQHKPSDEENNELKDGSIEIEEKDEQEEEKYEDISQSLVEEQEKQHEETHHTYIEENVEEEDKNNDQLSATEEEGDDQNIKDNGVEMEENYEDNDKSVAEVQENDESDYQYVEDIDESGVELDENNDQSVAKEHENDHESDNQSVEESEVELNYEDDDISVLEEQDNQHEESDNQNLEVEDEQNDQSDEKHELEQENYEEMDQEIEGDVSDEEEEFEQESYEEIEQNDQEVEGETETNKHITRNSENTRTEDVINDPRYVTHDTTGRNRKKIHNKTNVQSPEALPNNKTNASTSFIHRGRNTSIRYTKSMIRPDLRPSLAANRDSIGTTGSNSSAQGSGWDSHRNERKTLRQTFGRDFTPRKSLRALVMEKSAKRQTLPESLPAENPQANSTEINVNFNEPSDDDDLMTEESNHDVSKAARLADLEARLDVLKDEIIARKQRMKENGAQPYKAPRQNYFTDFKLPSKPGFGARKGIKPAPSMAKSKPTFSNALLSTLTPELREHLDYKPPKRFNKASWCTKRLYKFLETKLEPKYDYKARVRAETLVEKLFYFGKSIKNLQVASKESIDELKYEMARLNIVKTHHDFYNFFKDYLPRDIKLKVVPDCVNKIPVPRDVFGDILRENVQG